MVEVFISDIENKSQADKISSSILNENAEFKINFDYNETDFPFPCGHTILRIEGVKIDADKILTIVKTAGFNCEVLEDKVCKPREKS